MRQQAGTGDAAFYRTAGCRRLHDAVATGASQLGTNMADDPETGGNEFKLFGNIFAQLPQSAAAVGTSIVLWQIASTKAGAIQSMHQTIDYSFFRKYRDKTNNRKNRKKNRKIITKNFIKIYKTTLNNQYVKIKFLTEIEPE
jgi:hypothetical protein